jgi:sugar-specific transcriptional regulator TrmB
MVLGERRLQLNTTCQRLCECLGVSGYEAKVYLSLVGVGATNARTLSMMSGVPRVKVYKVLRKLIDMGLVIVIPE